MSGVNPLRCILITPARNEELFIEKTIHSVINQTLLPIKWVVVNDGSTDGTAEIVARYAARYDWIGVVNMPPHRDRSFAAKVHCFNAGYETVKVLDHDIIGNLDADISFGKDYLEFLLLRFWEHPRLGVAGTVFEEEGYSSGIDSFEGESHVAGGCQLFRRQCFTDIGGYIPNKAGGIDWIAVTTARMMGWGRAPTERRRSSIIEAWVWRNEGGCARSSPTERRTTTWAAIHCGSCSGSPTGCRSGPTSLEASLSGWDMPTRVYGGSTELCRMTLCGFIAKNRWES